MADRYSEDELIAKLFKPVAGATGVFLDDDAAFLPPSQQRRYVVTTDALVAGVHFFADDPPGLIAKKALRVNLSDLAAKGAQPCAFLLTLCLPPDWTNDWLAAFAKGLHEDVDQFRCRLIGGDTTATPGPLTVSITAFGATGDDDIYIARKGAQPGDAIYVSGPIGDAALGLALRRDPTLAEGVSAEARDYLLDRYLRPNPRLDLLSTLRAHATAAMDISDGLAGDLVKLCRASGVSAVINLPLVPLSKAAREVATRVPALFETAITGGDDYEILFTANLSATSTRLGARIDGDVGVMVSAGAGLSLPRGVVRIGNIVAGNEPPVFLDSDGKTRNFKKMSFQHF